MCMGFKVFVLVGMMKVMGVGQVETAATAHLPAPPVGTLATFVLQGWSRKRWALWCFRCRLNTEERRVLDAIVVTATKVRKITSQH